MVVSEGFEVIRDGQGFSTKDPEKTDIIIRKIPRSISTRTPKPKPEPLPMSTRETPTPSAQVTKEAVPITPPVSRGTKIPLDRDFISFGERDSSAISRGLPEFVTTGEAEQLRREGVPETFIEVKRDVSPSQAIETGAFFGGLGLQRATSPTLKTRGVTIFNIEQAEIAKESFARFGDIKSQFELDPKSFVGEEGVIAKVKEGEVEEITLTSEFFEKEFADIPSLAKKRAREKFEGLPSGVQTKLQLGGFAVGGGQALIGVPEFGGTLATSLGVQTFKEGDLKKDRGFKFGGSLGEIATLPKGISEYSGMVAVGTPFLLLGSGGIRANIKELGFRKGLIESASGLSPLRIKPIITPKITEQFDVLSFEKQVGGKTFTTTIGTQKGYKDIQIFSEQLAGQKGGIQVTTLKTPVFEFRGGDLTRGIQTQKFFTAFEGKPTGKFGFTGMEGTIPLFRSFAFPKKSNIDIFLGQKPILTEFSGLRKPVGEKAFVFISGEKIFGFTKTGVRIGGGKPTRRFFEIAKGFKPQIRGVGFTQASSSKTDAGFTAFGKGKQVTPFSKTFVKQTTQFSGISGITKLKPPKLDSGVGGIVGGVGGASVVTGLRTTKISPIVTTRQIPQQFQTEITKPKFVTGARTITKQPQRAIETQVFKLDVGLKTKQSQKLKQQLDFAQPKQTITTPQRFGFRDFGLPFGFIPPIVIPFGFGEKKRKAPKTRRAFKKTPTFFGAIAPEFGFEVLKPPKEFEKSGVFAIPFKGMKIELPNL